MIGGGDTAMEEALFLTRFASKVTVVHRRDKLRASKVMQEKAFANPKIEFLWNSEIEEILGVDKGEVTGMVVKNLVTGETSTLDVDGVFVAIGHTPNTELFRNHLALNPNGYIVTKGTHTQRRRCVRRGRCAGLYVPPGDHRCGIGLHGRDRCGAVSREHGIRRARSRRARARAGVVAALAPHIRRPERWLGAYER